MNPKYSIPLLIGLMFSLLFIAGCSPLETVPTPTLTVSTDTPTQPPPTDTILPTQAVTDTQPTNTQVSVPQPTEVAPEPILQGKFEGVGKDHSGSGTATVYKRGDGSYYLTFENFAVCCGPDLYVFLARKTATTDTSDLGNYIEVNALNDITGDQEYEIPVATDFSQIKSVVIYCKPYQVVISSATLR